MFTTHNEGEGKLGKGKVKMMITIVELESNYFETKLITRYKHYYLSSIHHTKLHPL
jgi:hypothetical protein